MSTTTVFISTIESILEAMGWLKLFFHPFLRGKLVAKEKPFLFFLQQRHNASSYTSTT